MFKLKVIRKIMFFFAMLLGGAVFAQSYAPRAPVVGAIEQITDDQAKINRANAITRDWELYLHQQNHLRQQNEMWQQGQQNRQNFQQQFGNANSTNPYPTYQSNQAIPRNQQNQIANQYNRVLQQGQAWTGQQLQPRNFQQAKPPCNPWFACN